MTVIASGLAHVRRNAIAYLALFLALAGGSYAAAMSPRATTASTAAATVQHWAHISDKGKMLASSAGGRVTVLGGGVLSVSWGVKLSARCVPLANLDVTMGPNATGGGGGFAGTGVGGTQVVVKTFTSRGKTTLQSFYIAVICP